MKVIATSDTHGVFPEIDPCDLLLIGGDVCPVNQSHDVAKQRYWLRSKFFPWLRELPADEIVWIGGNHDFACEQPGFYRIAEQHYLEDEWYETKSGLKVYGNPYVPNLRNWAFYKSDSSLREMVIPEADIYLLHSPVSGILDGGHPEWATPWAAEIYKHKPKAVICGHIHEGYGAEVIGNHGIPFYNVAHMNENYNPVNPPVTIEL